MKHRFASVTVSALFIISAIALPGYSQQVPMDKKASTLAEKKGMPAGDPGMDEEEVTHPFLTHMGVPEGVGVYNLRLAGLATRADGATKGDFAFHFETGLTKFIGLHVRNDRFLTNTAPKPCSSLPR